MNKTPNNEHEAVCPWEAGDLGNSEEHAVVLGAEHEKALDESLAMQLISIRLPRALIEELKFIAAKEGLGYQPLMRRVLQRFTEWEFKNMAREVLVREKPLASSNTSRRSPFCVQADEPPNVSGCSTTLSTVSGAHRDDRRSQPCREWSLRR